MHEGLTPKDAHARLIPKEKGREGMSIHDLAQHYISSPAVLLNRQPKKKPALQWRLHIPEKLDRLNLVPNQEKLDENWNR
uniref:Uncharacterized protein n=1 Tax=Oryza sativa subsp. japonica TaxID=39947 RepID=Q6K1W8_ORYSJ|nr:hypothetical protein [Oryza sativa Japonica Group]BAD23750.1 hypothetical protein [Oryza sativa Japonica Group]